MLDTNTYFRLKFLGSRACSECSSEHCGCGNHLDDDGPNHINFLATTTEVTRSPPKNDSIEQVAVENVGSENNDLQMQLHRVLGALESNIELRKQNKPSTDHADRSNVVESSEVDLESNFMEEACQVNVKATPFSIISFYLFCNIYLYVIIIVLFFCLL